MNIAELTRFIIIMLRAIAKDLAKTRHASNCGLTADFYDIRVHWICRANPLFAFSNDQGHVVGLVMTAELFDITNDGSKH